MSLSVGRRWEGSMARYSFVTEWRLDAPIDRVYDTINDSLAWPDWWPAVKAVEEIRPATGRGGMGSVRRYVFKGKLPYALSFDMTVERNERPRVLAGRAAGELEGTGVWSLREEDGVTLVRYEWKIRTTRLWMNVLAPLAGGLFKSNHDFVMQSGRRESAAGSAGSAGRAAGSRRPPWRRAPTRSRRASGDPRRESAGSDVVRTRHW
jgi:uncharacterized protein YndB with AHSA1/START domain